MTRVKIAGVGRALPPRVLTNADLEAMVDTSDEWIVERTGIRSRRVLDDGLTNSDLAAEAGRQACEQAGVAASELDAIIVATVTPDQPMPATAVHVQRKLGAPACAAFDIAAACAGFVYGLTVAESLVRSGSYRRVLMIGSEIFSRALDWSDRNTCVLFGDGAGAVVLVPADSTESSQIVGSLLAADGAHAQHLEIPAGGANEPASAQTVQQARHALKMNGRQVFSLAVKNMGASSKTLLERHGWAAADVDVVFAHQANLRIVESLSQRMGIALDRFFNNIDKYGNTSSASIPIGMSEAVEQGRLKKGDRVLLTGLGAGVAWGSILLRW